MKCLIPGQEKKVFTKSQMKELLQKTGLEVTRDTAYVYSIAVATVLYDKLHFGKTKLHQTLKQIEDLFDSIDKEYVSIEDLLKVLEEEADVIIESPVNSNE